MNPVITLNRDKTQATVSLSLEQIKLNRERRMYYYMHNAEKWLKEAGYKPLECLKAVVVDNVSNMEGEWVWSLETPKKKKEKPNKDKREDLPSRRPRRNRNTE